MGWNGIWVGLLGAGLLVAACGQTAKNGDAHGGAPSGAGTTSTATGGSGGSSGFVDPLSAGNDGGGTTGAGDPDDLVGGAGADNSPHGGSTPGGATNGGSTNGGSGGSTQSILDVKRSPGCGMPAPQPLGELVMHTLHTEGVKDANCEDHLANGDKVCGPWSLEREYYLALPPSYDPAKAYPLVLEAPGCGGDGKNIFPLAGVSNSVIRVGLTPAPNSIGHGTNPGQGCFDDKEGDDSVDFVFYENLLDSLKTQLCYDENRVYAAGENGGGWLVNELACKYAGDKKGHALRGSAVQEGGMPNQPQWEPTCTGKPVAGIWIYNKGDPGTFSPYSKFAINRVMATNSCTTVKDIDDAQTKGELSDFPIGSGFAQDVCKRIKGCDPLYPLVVCLVPGSTPEVSVARIEAGFSTFFGSLAAP